MICVKDQSEIFAEQALVAVKFDAEWSGYSNKINKVLEKLEKEFAISIYDIDVDKFKSISSKLDIKEVPTVMLIYNGVEIARAEGVILIAPLRNLFRKVKESL